MTDIESQCSACGALTPTHPDGAVCRACFTAELAQAGQSVCYYTVVLPPAHPSALPTSWHANCYKGTVAERSQTLTRGVFQHESQAHAWARANVAGHRYSVQWLWSGETRAIPGEFRTIAPGLWVLGTIGRMVAAKVWWGDTDAASWVTTGVVAWRD